MAILIGDCGDELLPKELGLPPCEQFGEHICRLMAGHKSPFHLCACGQISWNDGGQYLQARVVDDEVMED